jgi:hypothetical protein
MHEFFENLIHLHCAQITALLRRKLEAHFAHRPAPTCFNSPCFAFDQPHSDRPLASLEDMLTAMLTSNCSSRNQQERT